MGNPSSTLNKMVNQNTPGENESKVSLWRAANTQSKKLIGSGPVGTVIEAKNVKSKELCAIKIIEYEKRTDPIFLYAQKKAKRLVKLSKTKHPNIIKTHICETIEMENSFSIKHKFAFIMELLPINLNTLLASQINTKTVFDEFQLLIWILQMVSALLEAKKNGISHHNIKDENIFFDSTDKRLVLADFDIIESSKTAERMSVFSPPEFQDVNFNFDNYDHAKSDIYCMGLIFIKLALLIKQLTKEHKKNINDYLRLIETRGYKRLHQVLSGMLISNPNERPSLEEVFKSIQDHLLDLKGMDFFDEEAHKHYQTENQQAVKNLISSADMCRKSDDYKQSISLYERALPLIFQTFVLKKLDRQLQSIILQDLSLCYIETREIQKALRCLLKCAKIKKKYCEEKDVWFCYQGIGKLYTKLNDFQNALAWYQRSHEAYLAQGSIDVIKEVRILELVASSYENMEDFETSFEIYGYIITKLQSNQTVNSPKFYKVIKALIKLCKKMNKLELVKVYEKKAKELENS